MDKGKILKVASVACTIVGGILSIVTTLIDDKKRDMEIDDKIAQHFKDMEK